MHILFIPHMYSMCNPAPEPDPTVVAPPTVSRDADPARPTRPIGDLDDDARGAAGIPAAPRARGAACPRSARTAVKPGAPRKGR